MKIRQLQPKLQIFLNGSPRHIEVSDFLLTFDFQITSPAYPQGLKNGEKSKCQKSDLGNFALRLTIYDIRGYILHTMMAQTFNMELLIEFFRVFECLIHLMNAVFNSSSSK